jgi:hypothetical protein
MRKTIERLRGEFMEMPGLRLTPAQVQRLCGVDRTLCDAVLETLVAERFLTLKPDGTYTRLTDGRQLHPRAARAHLRAVEKRSSSR